MRVADTGLREASLLIQRELGDAEASVAYLRWWYFGNPSGHCPIYAYKDGADFSALATINGFRFSMNGRSKLVGMPQKVLVARVLRGQGVFGALYGATEMASRDEGSDFFLTFTNAASTPIFLGKFGYVRGTAPDTLVIPFNPLAFLRPRRYKRVDRPSDAFLSTGFFRFDNAVEKTADYLRWRYHSRQPEQYTILEVPADGGSTAGYLYLKKISKKGIPIHLLMDVAARAEDDMPLLLSQASAYSSRHGAAAMLAFSSPPIDEALGATLHKRIAGRFNFLVKGKDAAETAALASTRFCFSFGDLDFI
ncbi:MAG: hypothetical protein HYZ75_15525 [Elusimicrobia bacterium]|nr:hypothetical protein [Elusimicrobiota bacterium]